MLTHRFRFIFLGALHTFEIQYIIFVSLYTVYSFLFSILLKVMYIDKLIARISYLEGVFNLLCDLTKAEFDVKQTIFYPPISIFPFHFY